VSTAVFFGYYWTRFPLGESRKVVVHGSMLATGVDLNRLFRPLYPLTGRCAIRGGLLDPKVAWRSEGAPSPFELGLRGGRQLLEGISVLQSIGFRGLQQAFQIPESRIGSVSQSSVFGKSLPDSVPDPPCCWSAPPRLPSEMSTYGGGGDKLHDKTRCPADHDR
jgi:hypothetical protein